MIIWGPASYRTAVLMVFNCLLLAPELVCVQVTYAGDLGAEAKYDLPLTSSLVPRSRGYLTHSQ